MEENINQMKEKYGDVRNQQFPQFIEKSLKQKSKELHI
jgi:hypothetical protein